MKEVKEEVEGPRSGWRRGRRDPGDKEEEKKVRGKGLWHLCDRSVD